MKKTHNMPFDSPIDNGATESHQARPCLLLGFAAKLANEENSLHGMRQVAQVQICVEHHLIAQLCAKAASHTEFPIFGQSQRTQD